MDSRYSLVRRPTDDERSSATSEESSSSEDVFGSSGALERTCTAYTQIVAGRQVPPSCWGMTRQQVSDLLVRLRKDPAWIPQNNVYTLVERFIIPWTSGSGVGYALLLNQAAPKKVNVMVSHAFAEQAEEFLEAVIRATREDDVIFICALAIYQAEDAAGPKIAEQLGTTPQDSPFQQVLHSIQLRGDAFSLFARWTLYRYLEELPVLLFLLCTTAVFLPVMAWKPYLDRFMNYDQWSKEVRAWLYLAATFAGIFCFFFPLTLLLIRRRSHRKCAFSGRMIVVPNRESDIYSRLWCVYEIFVAEVLGVPVTLAPTLAPAGKVSSRLSVCGSACDTARIRAEIEESRFDYDDIDDAVKRVIRGSLWHSLWTFAKYDVLQVLPLLLFFDLPTRQGIPVIPVFLWYMLFAGAYSAILFMVYAWVKRVEGIIHVSSLGFAICVGVLIVQPFCFYLALSTGSMESWWAPLLMGVSFEVWTLAAVIVACLCRPFPTCFKSEYRLCTLASLACVFFCLKLIRNWKLARRRVLGGSFIESTAATWTLIIPFYTAWTEGRRFGIQVKLTTATKEARYGKVAVMALGFTALEYCATMSGRKCDEGMYHRDWSIWHSC